MVNTVDSHTVIQLLWDICLIIVKASVIGIFSIDINITSININRNITNNNNNTNITNLTSILPILPLQPLYYQSYQSYQSYPGCPAGQSEEYAAASSSSPVLSLWRGQLPFFTFHTFLLYTIIYLSYLIILFSSCHTLTLL